MRGGISGCSASAFKVRPRLVVLEPGRRVCPAPPTTRADRRPTNLAASCCSREALAAMTIAASPEKPAPVAVVTRGATVRGLLS